MVSRSSHFGSPVLGVLLAVASLFAFALPHASLGALTPLADVDATNEREEEKTDRPPNVVFILADDLGFSDLGCYGGEIETRVLDSLAENGLRYTQFRNTGRCWPTRASLLSGYYPHQINRDHLPTIKSGMRGKRQKWARLLPDLLKPAGYRSYHSGKWHIDGKILASGFDHSLNMVNQGNFFSPVGNHIDDKKIEVFDGDYYATNATTDHAIKCLKEHKQNHAEKPFFQYVAYIAPHFPLHAKQADIDKYRDKYLGGWNKLREARYKRQLEIGLFQKETTQLSAVEEEVGPPYNFPDAMEKLGDGEVNRPVAWEKLTEKQKRFQATKMAIHAAMVDRMDQEIGRLIGQLKTMGEFENTIICFASDNGASAEIMVRNGGHDPEAPMGSEKSYLCLGPGFSNACNTPFRRHKTWVHEGGTATPFIVHWPAGIKAKGELRRRPAHVIDFVPTVLDIASIKKPEDWKGTPIPASPGRSLLKSFAKDWDASDSDRYFWFHDKHRAVQVGNLKLVSAKDEAWELFDLSKDRAETKDLVEAMPEKAKQLETVWNELVEEMTEYVKKK